LPIYVEQILVADVIDLDVNETKPIEYSVLPENASIKSVDLISSNTDIVGVDGNYIIGKNKGEATITLISKDGGNISSTATVNCRKKVTGISIASTEMVISKSTPVLLSYTVLPTDADNKAVNIFAEDESIVIVDGQSIIGIDDGSTIVTIETQDGRFRAKVFVTVFGDYVWYNYPLPIDILNASDINNIQSNITTIRNLLIMNGYTVEQLNEIVASPNLLLKDIFDILQSVEYNLDIINNADAKSIYYIEPKTIGEYAPNKTDIWRWLQILNDMYLILTGVFGKWQRLRCADGYPTITGKTILLRGEKLG
jgi:hypothetical protein